jgi:hypothetical protein
MGVYRRAATSGKTMRFVVGTPTVQRVFSITGVDRLVDIYPSVAASLGDPGGQADQGRPDSATATADTDGGV